jgi:hypothetical protein
MQHHVIEDLLRPSKFETCTPLRVRSKSDAHPEQHEQHELLGKYFGKNGLFRYFLDLKPSHDLKGDAKRLTGDASR